MDETKKSRESNGSIAIIRSLTDCGIRRQLSYQRLSLDKILVLLTPSEQRVVATNIYNFVVVQYDYLLRPLNGAQTMRHNDNRSANHCLFNGLLYQVL